MRFCSDAATWKIFETLNDAKSFSIFFMRYQTHPEKKQLAFCMKYIDENDKICEKSSMFLYGKSRLTGKDSFKEITDIIS